MYKLYLITPSILFIKNYILYKKYNIITLYQTPIIYLFLDKIFNYYNINNIILLSLISERWISYLINIIKYIYLYIWKKKIEKNYLLNI